jgi:hypothetical protein
MTCLNYPLANHPAAGNAGFTRMLTIERNFPGVPEPGR